MECLGAQKYDMWVWGVFGWGVFVEGGRVGCGGQYLINDFIITISCHKDEPVRDVICENPSHVAKGETAK